MKKFIRYILLKTPPRIYYNLFLNTLGLQVIRATAYHLKWKLMRLFKYSKAPNIHAETLEKQGYVAIPDFLEDKDFEELKNAYYNNSFELPLEKDIAGPKLVTHSCSSAIQISNETIFNILGKNKKIKNIIEYAAAKKSNLNPLVKIHHYFTHDSDIGIRETAQTDTLHYDVPLKNFRCFFYVEPCSKDNAAFEYAPKTHLYNMKRTKLEYYDSIHHIKELRKKEQVTPPIPDKLLKGYLKEIIPIEGDANTLVIFNTMGLHRRGIFQKSGIREAILIDYRHMDSILNRLPFLKSILNKK